MTQSVEGVRKVVNQPEYVGRTAINHGVFNAGQTPAGHERIHLMSRTLFDGGAGPAEGGGWAESGAAESAVDLAEGHHVLTEMSKISDIAVSTRQNPPVRVGIDGATDLLRGTNQYNAALSQQRVSNVREALIRGGVPADRIGTGGFGVERAKCNDSSELCSQRDGRVEVMVRPAS